jgi:hypothetical protein
MVEPVVAAEVMVSVEAVMHPKSWVAAPKSRVAAREPMPTPSSRLARGGKRKDDR